MVEIVKLKVDLRKSYLNHLLVLIITIGAGVGKMLLNGDIGMLTVVGIFIIVMSLVLYTAITSSLENEIREIKW